MSGVWSDWRYAARSLKRQPGFICLAGLVLAIGIAAVASMLGVVEAVDKPVLPFAAPGRIVLAERLVASPNLAGGQLRSETVGIFRRFQAAHALSNVAAFRFVGDAQVTEDGGNVLVAMNAVTPNFFSVLGVRPFLGRFLSAADTGPGAPRVIVVTFDFWKHRLGARPGALGHTVRVTLRDAPHTSTDFTVVGVLPPGIPDFTGARGIGQFVPLRLGAHGTDADSDQVAVFGRLGDGATIASAQQELTRLTRNGAASSEERTLSVVVRPMQELFGYVAPARFSLLVIAILVLAMAALNVANLMLARGAAHAQETAVRIALGASRSRIIHRFVADSVIISVVGGMAAIPLTIWGAHMASIALGLAAGGWQVTFDARVLGLTIAAVALAAVACGLLPALAAARHGTYGVIRGAGHIVDRRAGWRRLTGALLVAQVAGALSLVFGAGVITRDFRRTVSTAPGLDATHVLEVSFPMGLSHASEADVLSRMIASLTNLPAVRAAGLVAGTLDDTVESADDAGAIRRMPIEEDALSAGTLHTLGVRPLAGRLLDSADFRSLAPVVLVNDVLANAYWPNESAVGKTIQVIRSASNAPPHSGLAQRQLVTIVGVIRSMALFHPPGAKALPQLFTQSAPLAPADAQSLYVLTTIRPVDAAADVRRAIQAVDEQDYFEDAVQPLGARIDRESDGLRFAARGLGLGALLATIVASLGVYGLVAYTMSSRSHEMAIRMALGASERRVIQSALSLVTRLAMLGIACGGACSVALSRILTHVSADAAALSLDLGSFLVSAAAVVGAVIVAGFIPAHRASQLDPAITMRAE
jgi:putative ABC transport system permease protein